MKVRYIGWHDNEYFTQEGEYEGRISDEGHYLEVYDNTGSWHIIGIKEKGLESFTEDKFFRNNFEFV